MKNLIRTTLVLALALSFAGRVAAQPTITAQPQSRTNNIGDNARFSVTASGTGTLVYQWKFGGVAIEGATGSALNVLLTNPNQAGAYTVVVNDDSGLPVESSEAVLHILFGDRQIIAQWNFNSVVPDGNPATGTLGTSIGSGTTNWINMTLDNWRAGSSSDPASVLTGAGHPDNSGRSLRGPAAATANKGGGPRFNVSTEGFKNIVVSWEQYGHTRSSAYWRGQYTINGTDWIDRILVDKRTPYVQTGELSYTFHSDDLSDVEGVANNLNFGYRIMAEHESTAIGSGSDAYVSVDEAAGYATGDLGHHRWDMITVLGTLDDTVTHPEIATHPQNQTVPVGDTAAFSVLATGGSLQYQWHYNGEEISGATGSTYSINNVQLTDAGSYSVVVSNSVGFVTSNDGVLTVVESIEPGERFFAGDGSTLGSAGVWNTTGLNWGLTEGGPFDLRWNNANGDIATFQDLAGHMTVGENVVVNKMRVMNNQSGGNRHFTGGSITFVGEDAGIFIPGTGSTSTTNTVVINATPLLLGDALVKTGGGRLRIDASASHTISKWIVAEGIISATTGSRFGPAPAELVPDFFIFDENAGIGFSGSSASSIGANRGVYLRGNGKLGVSDTGSTLTIDAPITGPGGIRFPGFSSFPGQQSGAAGTFVFNNPNSDYQGGTTISVGTLRCGAAGVLPSTTTVSISGSSILNINGFNQSVGNVILSGSNARIQDTVGGATLVATNYDARQGGISTAVLGGNANFTKTTSGTVILAGANTYTGDTILKQGTIELSGAGRFGDGTGTVHLDGSEGNIAITLRDSQSEGAALSNPVVLTANLATLQSHLDAVADVVFRHSGPWTTVSGTLELWNSSLYSFEAMLSGEFEFTSPINLGSSCRLTSYSPSGAQQTYSGGISGSGSFRRSASEAGGRTVFTTENSYSGGTIVDAGELVVNNPWGTGTGWGEVTVSGPSGVLSGTGFIGGNVVVNDGGSISGGDGVGVLTLQNGLNLGGGGTMVWDLGALKDNSDGVAGTDFDQLVISGGELQLGGSSKLLLQFATGTAPNGANAFWQASRSWVIARLEGGANSANLAFASIVNGSHGAGDFSTSLDSSGNVVLAFVPGAQTGPSITSHPQNQTRVQGTAATFTVGASGSEPLSYQWWKVTPGTPPTYTQISGATSATLTLPNVQPADAVQYFAVVGNAMGTATSSPANLTVVPPPGIEPLSGAGTSQVVVRWNTVAGGSYRLEYNTNLATTVWHPVTNFVASGGSVSVTNAVTVGEKERYYRLVLE